jgi:hypothetical protein
MAMQPTLQQLETTGGMESRPMAYDDLRVELESQVSTADGTTVLPADEEKRVPPESSSYTKSGMPAETRSSESVAHVQRALQPLLQEGHLYEPSQDLQLTLAPAVRLVEQLAAHCLSTWDGESIPDSPGRVLAHLAFLNKQPQRRWFEEIWSSFVLSYEHGAVVEYLTRDDKLMPFIGCAEYAEEDEALLKALHALHSRGAAEILVDVLANGPRLLADLVEKRPPCAQWRVNWEASTGT